jgi:hypothetical protein
MGLMTHQPYLYGGYTVTIETKQGSDGKWRGSATIENKTTGTSYEVFPPPDFATEREAYEATKKLAEDRIDSPRVKPDVSN